MKTKFFVVFFLFPFLLFAQTREHLFHQGLVFDAENNPLSGPFEVTFRIYDSMVNGNLLWEETGSLEFVNGVFTAELGEHVPFPGDLFDRESLYLAVQIEGDREFTPRLPLFSVPWSQQAEVAVTALSLQENVITSAHIGPGVIEGSDLTAGAIGATELASSGVTPGTYTLATVVVDTDGRITSAASGSAGGGAGDITAVNAGTGLSGGGSSGDVTLSAVLGTSIESAEITDGTITSADLSATAGLTDAQVSDTLTASNLVAGSSVVADAEVEDNLTLSGGTINNSVVGGTTPAAGTFTLVTVDGTTADGLVMLAFGTAAGQTAEFRFRELDANGSNYVGFKAPDAITANQIWTLPNTDGSSGQFLKTDGAGLLAWDSPAESGDISAVTAGSGLTGGGTTGAVTLDIGAGTGLTVSADSVGISSGGVSTSEIANGTITSTDISNTAGITDAQVNDNLTISATGSVADGALSANVTKLGQTIESAELTDATVAAADIGTDAVGSDEIATDAVGSAEIAADAVGSSELVNNSVTGAKIALGSDAQGDVIYYNGTDWARLAAGTTGQFLQTQGAGANPTWASSAAAAAPNVVNVTDTTTQSLTDADVVITDSNPSITLANSTNRVLITVSVNIDSDGTDDEVDVFKVWRSTDCTGTQVGASLKIFTTNTVDITSTSATFVDSPATAGSVTYSFCHDDEATGTVSNDTLVVTITLMEIAP